MYPFENLNCTTSNTREHKCDDFMLIFGDCFRLSLLVLLSSRLCWRESIFREKSSVQRRACLLFNLSACHHNLFLHLRQMNILYFRQL